MAKSLGIASVAMLKKLFDLRLPRASGRMAVICLLSLLILFHVFFNVWWLAVDNHPYAGDEPVHMNYARGYWQALFGSPGAGLVQSVITAAGLDVIYPPSGYLLGVLVMGVFGRSPDALAFSSTLCLVALLLGTYAFCRTFLKKPEALLATFVTGFTPVIYGASRYFSIDFPTVALIPWVLFALVRTDRYQRTDWAAVLGGLCGLSVMVKPHAVLFWVMPAGFVAVQGLCAAWPWRPWKKPEGPSLYRTLRNLTVAASLALVVAAPWFISKVSFLYDFWALDHSKQGLVRLPSPSIDWACYPFMIINNCVFLPLFSLGLLGMIFVLARRRFRSTPAVMAVLWAVGSYVLLTVLLTQKEARYMLPAIPALAILATIGLLGLPGRLCRVAVTAAFALVLVIQHLTLTCGLTGEINYGTGGDNIRLESPWPSYHRTDTEIFYFGTEKLALYRNVLISDAYSYCPPYVGDNYIDRSFRAIVSDLHANPPLGAEWVPFRTATDIDTMTGEPNSAWFYEPEPNPFAITRWRPQEKLSPKPLQPMRGFDYLTPEEMLPGFPIAGYLICKISLNGTAVARWHTFFARHDFRVLTEFYDRGYGVCPPGHYLVVACPQQVLPDQGLAPGWG